MSVGRLDGRWAIGATYFAYFAGAAVLLPSLALVFERHGFRAGRIGALTAMVPLVSTAAGLVWSVAADRTGRTRPLLMAAGVGAGVCAAVMAVPHGFALTFLTVAGFAWFLGPIVPLVDAAAVATPGGYGRLRWWGALGWGISAPIVGALIDAQGLGVMTVAFLTAMAAVAVLAIRVPEHPPARTARPRTFDKRWGGLLAIVAVLGLGSGVIHTYLFLHLDRLGASATLMGLSLTIATVSELAVFWWSDRVVERIGPMAAFAVGGAALVARLAILALVPSIGAVLAAQFLHGLTFSLPWAAAVIQASRLADGHRARTAQGTISGMSMGVAPAIAAAGGGAALEFVDTGGLFGAAALVVTVGVAVTLVGTRRAVSMQ